MKPQELLKEKINLVLKELQIEDFNYSIEFTASLDHGDFATNTALVLYPKIKNRFKSPKEFASHIVHELEQDNELLAIFSQITVDAGFINFHFSKEYLITSMIHIIKAGEHAEVASSYEKQRIMLEFGDPNPFKEFHIGHLRNITLGESFARLLEAQGGNVVRANYQGDVGLHVAKAIFGMLQKLKTENLKLKVLEDMNLEEKVRFLGEAYALGSKAFKEDSKAKEEIQELNKKIYQKDSSIKELWEKGRKWSLEEFNYIYRRLCTQYDHFYFESETAVPGREIVLSNIGFFERHEGAVVYRGEDEGLHTRVFITKDDYSTYEAKDLALAKMKYNDFTYDRSIIITAHEQGPYFKVILSAMSKIFPDLAKKTLHYSFGFVSLKDEKMSSRLGNVVAATWLLDEVKTRIKKAFVGMDEHTLEKVAVGAVKYSLLKFSPNVDIKFAFDESISLEGNSGPYLQYTFARTQSVLSKAQSSKLKAQNDWKLENRNSKLNPEELTILRLLVRFQDVVEGSAIHFSPNLLCSYLFELAQEFNLFYQKHSILEGGKAKEFRLLLTQAVGKTIKTGLFLLGIQTSERM